MFGKNITVNYKGVHEVFVLCNSSDTDNEIHAKGVERLQQLETAFPGLSLQNLTKRSVSHV